VTIERTIEKKGWNNPTVRGEVAGEERATQKNEKEGHDQAYESTDEGLYNHPGHRERERGGLKTKERIKKKNKKRPQDRPKKALVEKDSTQLRKRSGGLQSLERCG